VGKQEKRYNLEDLRVDGRIILKRISSMIGDCGLN
jgi:hypothetical protein